MIKYFIPCLNPTFAGMQTAFSVDYVPVKVIKS